MTDGLKRGTVKALAGRLGRPAWWVKKRAVTLGLTQVRIKEPEWSPAEVELLEANGHKNPDVIRRIFARKGFRRSATSIVVKRKRLAINTTNPDHFTASGP